MRMVQPVNIKKLVCFIEKRTDEVDLFSLLCALGTNFYREATTAILPSIIIAFSVSFASLISELYLFYSSKYFRCIVLVNVLE